MSVFDRLRRQISKGSSQGALAAPEVAPNHRIYAVGDVHGRADLLLQLHELIRSDAQSNGRGRRKTIVYLGDYLDRGLNSKSVIDILEAEPLEKFDHIFLCGNHEDMMLACRDDAGLWPRWLRIGGTATLLSYGIAAKEVDSELTRQEFFDRIPQAHLRFFANLQISFRSGDYLFVHAGIRPRVPLERQDPHDMMWIREEFLRHKGPLGVVVVHGHSITLKPEFLSERIGIDTGAYATNVLSCVVLDGSSRAILSTGKLEPQRREP